MGKAAKVRVNEVAADHAGAPEDEPSIDPAPDRANTHRVRVHLDELMAARGMTLVELSEKVDVTVANLSILKNGHARAVRFTTLTALCDVLGCSPGELLTVRAE